MLVVHSRTLAADWMGRLGDTGSMALHFTPSRAGEVHQSLFPSSSQETQVDVLLTGTSRTQETQIPLQAAHTFVVVESLVEVSFLQLLHELATKDMLASVFVDEAQALVTDSSFRGCMHSIKHAVGRIHGAARPRIVLASGTLPGSYVSSAQSNSGQCGHFPLSSSCWSFPRAV